MTIKIGLHDLREGSPFFFPPHFAYLQTKNASTAKSIYEPADSDPGFRVFVIGHDPAVRTVVEEMLESTAVTLGFNFKKDGLDVLLPLDLTVRETDAQGRKQHSTDTMVRFLECIGTMADAALRELEKPKE